MTTLTMKEEKRLDLIQRVYRSELTAVQAAHVMGVSERQCYRVKARVGKLGAKGVVHGNRGRACQRKIKDKVVKRIVELALGKYQDFNDHHLTEKLEELEKISLSREKVCRILRAHGIVSPRKRRGIKHRSRRERRISEGMMLQVDGSPHERLQGRGPRLCLIGAIPQRVITRSDKIIEWGCDDLRLNCFLVESDKWCRYCPPFVREVIPKRPKQSQ